MASWTRRTWLVAVPLVALVVSGEALAAGGWTLVGRRNVTDRVDHDTIRLPRPARYAALTIKVRGRAVQFRDMKVHYANGGVQDVSLRDVIRAGGESRVIDLRGDGRDITRIEFWYDAQTLGRGRGARVEVWGRRD